MPTPVTSATTRRTSARTYPGTADQAKLVRSDLRALLAGCPSADDIILCASELATNAAIHSRSGQPGGSFTVRADVRPGDWALIEVHDDGGPWPKQVPDPDRPHGLDIIRILAARWGITGTNDGRVSWAQFTWPAA
jgi:serine/threonine-protein kinase RsbW